MRVFRFLVGRLRHRPRAQQGFDDALDIRAGDVCHQGLHIQWQAVGDKIVPQVGDGLMQHDGKTDFFIQFKQALQIFAGKGRLVVLQPRQSGLDDFLDRVFQPQVKRIGRRADSKLFQRRRIWPVHPGKGRVNQLNVRHGTRKHACRVPGVRDVDYASPRIAAGCGPKAADAAQRRRYAG